MPLKGIILVFIIALAIVVTCWKDIYPAVSQWLKEETNNEKEKEK